MKYLCLILAAVLTVGCAAPARFVPAMESPELTPDNARITVRLGFYPGTARHIVLMERSPTEAVLLAFPRGATFSVTPLSAIVYNDGPIMLIESAAYFNENMKFILDGDTVSRREWENAALEDRMLGLPVAVLTSRENSVTWDRAPGEFALHGKIEGSDVVGKVFSETMNVEGGRHYTFSVEHGAFLFESSETSIVLVEVSD